MPNLGLQVEVVVNQLHLEVGIVGNEGIVAGHAVVKVRNALVQLLHLPLHHIMPTQNTICTLLLSQRNIVIPQYDVM